ncbi:hypothetical protein [Desulfosporosinus sp. Sb-LF]|uniref:hypothetical protein n=1 Tax=Desulfosporosinus sp. Sb-LF TaxID=2560027 RepID=UPI00107F3BDC|nr:hypothetical protein [Desulfosporosinus sp. Sb-LF]TGE33544.1 hypothetical protein E4K68_05190 [Desulfosporosinus sp. Sb-LF]
MKKCDELILLQRFTSTGQDSGIRKLCESEVAKCKVIHDGLIASFEEKAGKVSDGTEIQVINKFTASNDECVSPAGLVNVSLDYLAKLLTFADTAGIQWQVDITERVDSHFKGLFYCNVKVNCTKDEFVDLAKGKGFRC